MLLSIVLMVKNEEKFLDKTLNALNKIRNEINTELIILDTGSTDRTIEIARKYTDKVYFEKWNNNFADMRNKSISYAKGDWILILDADEELVECKKMIEFFKTNLHKKYNCASVELKNISSQDCKLYNTCINLRIFKNKDLRYEGAIHEQPIYKEPIFNNIASFNHYGYLYIDEDFKQKKLKRNESILLDEIRKKPNDPYINYQLGKNFMAIDKNQEALPYMEKSMNLYRKNNKLVGYVVSNLAHLYILLNKFDKCEDLCLEYIQKKSDKDIDIYYFLAVSQSFLYKYKESITHYERYIYLLENYDISIQANSIYATGTTIGLRKNAQVNIIKNFYYLEKYEEVISLSESLEQEQIKEIYDILFFSIYKTNKIDKLINIYNENINSKIDLQYIEYSLENMLQKVKENDKEHIYRELSKIEGSYGQLNKVRLKEKLNIEELNQILLDGKEEYYGDIIYHAINNDLDLIEILKNISYLHIQAYIDYITIYKKDCTQNLYNYLINQTNTLDLNKLNIYTCIAKSLLLNTDLYDEKYEKVFMIYINYRYEVIKQIYNASLSDKDLIYLVNDRSDKFILKLKCIQYLREKDQVKYIKEIRTLLLDYKEYKKIIEMFIDKFKDEFEESKELKDLKKQYKLIIENNINEGNVDDALIMINEYESMYSEDYEILNMKAIINIMSNNYEKAELLLKKSLLLNPTNANTIFNIAYLKEIKNENCESIKFYKKIIEISEDKDLIMEVKEKIKTLK